MLSLTESLGLLWEALFLQPEPYAAMRNQEKPVRKGLVILIVLGLVLALATFIGSILTWAGSPDVAAIQETVLRNLQQMSWWEMMAVNPQAEAMWMQIWDTVWQFVRIFNPSPSSGLAAFIVSPLSLIFSWIVFGLVAHVMARIFGGNGRLGQTLGVTSLAAAPQLLGLFTVFPFAALAGIGIWTLLARYLAIRVTHELSWGRAFWVTLLTIVVLFLLLFLLLGAGVAAGVAASSAGFQGGF
ncbi:MAG: YIP1 family protein [Candidatus Promineifilaceae bacterium]